MKATETIWMNGKLVRWDDAKVHVLTHTLHYGSGAFEGIRAYQTEHGTAIFRLREHIERLFYSAKALRMEIPFTVEEICAAAVELLAANKLPHAYIRPLVYHGYGIMGLRTKGAPVDVSIAAWEWGAYLPHEAVDVKVSSFVRIHPKSTVVDAKLCGHYVNSIMASLEVRDTEFHEALLLDSEGNISEGPGENIFIGINGELHTPRLGTILPGITRNTIIQIAKAKGIKIVERDIRPDELVHAQEAFFTGTAAEVTPIRSVDRNLIGDGKIGKITELMKSAYHQVVTGKDRSFERFLTYVG